MTAPIEELIVHSASFQEVGEPIVYVAAVAEGVDGSGFAIEFQRATEFDEQDRRMRMDTYCICTSEGPTHYGGVARVETENDAVVIYLYQEAADILSIPDIFRIRLLVPTLDKVAFIRGLLRVLTA